MRLTSLAVTRWRELDGWAAARRLPPLQKMPLGRFVNLVYHWATDGADQTEIAKFDARLFRPPPGVKAVVGPWTAEAEKSAFNALKAALGK